MHRLICNPRREKRYLAFCYFSTRNEPNMLVFSSISLALSCIHTIRQCLITHLLLPISKFCRQVSALQTDGMAIGKFSQSGMLRKKSIWVGNLLFCYQILQSEILMKIHAQKIMRARQLLTFYYAFYSKHQTTTAVSHCTHFPNII